MTRKTIMKLTAVLGYIALAGCSQRASRIDPMEANDIIEHLVFGKSSMGQCFGVVASRHVMNWNQNGFTITWVPCEGPLSILQPGDIYEPPAGLKVKAGGY